MVAQRGVEARKLAEVSAHLRTGWGAREHVSRVFEAMAVERPRDFGYGLTVLTLQDTPADRSHGLSPRLVPCQISVLNHLGRSGDIVCGGLLQNRLPCRLAVTTCHVGDPQANERFR